MNRFSNIDCLIGMAEYEDKHFDLAIVDPPYFEGPNNQGYYNGLGQGKGAAIAPSKDYHVADWEIPDQEYIDELIRCSKNQIIWGINYFNVALPGGRIVWIKAEGGTPFSQADIAYHSFYNRIDTFKCLWAGFWKDKKTNGEIRIHPTQKPVALYKWLLTKYAKQGDLILDTYVGSASSLIACEDMGFNYVGFELDSEYHAAAVKRLENYRKQIKLFTPEELNVK